MTDSLLVRRLGTAALVVTVNGEELQLDQLAAVTIHQGRRDTEGPGEPGNATLTTNAPLVPQVSDVVTVTLAADALAAYGADPDAAPRFRGHVTDADVTPEPGTSSRRRRCQLQAVTERARLGRVYVGDTPWPQELDGDRVGRLLDLAGVTVDTVDPGAVEILARDVDRQPLLQLMDRVALDAEAVLVELRAGAWQYQDANRRAGVSLAAVELTAEDILWPLRWTQNLQGMVNDLTVAWGDAEPQAEVRVTDPASIATHGTMASRISTQLATEADAEWYANLALGRRARPWWELQTLTVELLRHVDGSVHPKAAELLALQPGDLIALSGLAATGPAVLGRVWVEGWTETIGPTTHRLQLAVSSYGRSGSGVRWVDLADTLTWADVDPALTWRGVTSWDPGTPPDGRWVGQPSTLRWQDAVGPWDSSATPPDTYRDTYTDTYS